MSEVLVRPIIIVGDKDSDQEWGDAWSSDPEETGIELPEFDCHDMYEEYKKLMREVEERNRDPFDLLKKLL